MITPLRTAWAGNRPLTMLAGLMAALTVVTLAGLMLDDRTLGGQPVWLKPFKFAVSFVVYGLTLAWLMAHLRRGRRFARWTGGIIAVAAALEVAIITGQAARGRASHFNEATPLDETLFSLMGYIIIVLWLGTAIIAGMLWRDGMPDRAMTWAVRLGMVLLLAGLAQGSFMVVPTEAQLELDEREGSPMMGAHAVGVPDGGPGMPITGWSTTGGDLRVGHFVGIHALQATILFAMLLSWLVRDTVRRTRLVSVFAFAYAGLLVLVTWQALRGQPLVAPDGLTLAALAGLVGATAAGGLIAWGAPAKRQLVTAA
ncbi:hypothetical protein [Allorhizocola rhizosphaerae]|uniref:hypothetical protein n=1 Tax=Allorhizocola rhizosphaerae TaxID=1872709 RepID=UPI001B8A9C53|nr:hypothetical protein [Allorhizocola rhizosphaerae]